MHSSNETAFSLRYLKTYLFSFTDNKRALNYFTLKAPLGVGV
jgi:hypothetical protein